MTIYQQLKESFYYAPLSLMKLRKSSAKWPGIYFISGLVVFSLSIWLTLANQEALKQLLLDYFFPESWHSVSETLAEFFFESQAKSVLSNMILSGSLVLASIFLFPVKEKYSAEFEKDANFKNGVVHEFPLVYQAWEEVKLFLLYLTAQMVILWIGYYPYQWTNWLSISLSYLFLFSTFGLDFISPTLQRHRIQYSLILKGLFRKPLLILTFGFLFSLPVILLSFYIFTIEELSLIEISGILFLSNLLFLTLAIPAGTRIASTLLPDIRKTASPTRKTMTYSYSMMFMLLIAGLLFHGKLISSMHHKSQILKAEYSIDWSSIDFNSTSLSQFFNGEALSQLSFEMIINNPTEFDIVIEKSKIFVDKKEIVIATIDLSGFTIPAGESHRVKLQLDSQSDLSSITDYKTIFEDWHIDMHLELFPGIPFILNIID